MREKASFIFPVVYLKKWEYWDGTLECHITSMVSAFENWWEQRSNCLVYHRCCFVFMIPGQRDGALWAFQSSTVLDSSRGVRIQCNSGFQKRKMMLTLAHIMAQSLLYVRQESPNCCIKFFMLSYALALLLLMRTRRQDPG